MRHAKESKAARHVLEHIRYHKIDRGTAQPVHSDESKHEHSSRRDPTTKPPAPDSRMAGASVGGRKAQLMCSEQHQSADETDGTVAIQPAPKRNSFTGSASDAGQPDNESCQTGDKVPAARSATTVNMKTDAFDDIVAQLDRTVQCADEIAEQICSFDPTHESGRTPDPALVALRDALRAKIQTAENLRSRIEAIDQVSSAASCALAGTCSRFQVARSSTTAELESFVLQFYKVVVPAFATARRAAAVVRSFERRNRKSLEAQQSVRSELCQTLFTWHGVDPDDPLSWSHRDQPQSISSDSSATVAHESTSFKAAQELATDSPPLIPEWVGPPARQLMQVTSDPWASDEDDDFCMTNALDIEAIDAETDKPPGVAFDLSSAIAPCAKDQRPSGAALLAELQLSFAASADADGKVGKHTAFFANREKRTVHDANTMTSNLASKHRAKPSSRSKPTRRKTRRSQ
eukprot:SAG31_NODE_2871_length_4973_cov_4.568322_3_plen_462_part_00